MAIPTKEDGLFAALRRAVPEPKARDANKNAWILVSTWRLVNKRVSTRRYPVRDQAPIQRIRLAINTSLKGDRRQSTEKAGEEVKRLLLLDPPLHREAWHRMKGWYRSASDRVPPTSRVTLERIRVEQVELYRYVPPLGENIPVYV